MKKRVRGVVRRPVKKPSRKSSRRLSKKVSRKSARKSPLSGAMRDLQVEINKLSREKVDMKRSLGRVNSSIDLDRRVEKALQQKLASLLDKEARLNQRKKNLQTRIDRVSDKVNKISKIKSEMSDV